MPIGITSNFSGLMALNTEAALSREISCSPLRPPKRMPTRVFFMQIQFGRAIAFSSIARLIPMTEIHRGLLCWRVRACLVKLNVVQGSVLAAIGVTDNRDRVSAGKTYARDRAPGRGISVHLVGREMAVSGPGVSPPIIDQEFVTRDSVVLIEILDTYVVFPRVPIKAEAGGARVLPVAGDRTASRRGFPRRDIHRKIAVELHVFRLNTVRIVPHSTASVSDSGGFVKPIHHSIAPHDCVSGLILEVFEHVRVSF